MLFLVTSLFVVATIAADNAYLVTFDNAKGTTFDWRLTNDPVMGGLSYSDWTIDSGNKVAKWQGAVEIVPSLQAPGFCNVNTAGLTRFNDASAYSHMEIRIRSFIPYTGFKVSFAADTLNPQYASFKAPFEVSGDGQWHDVAIPFSDFSNDWSPYTGDCFTKDPNGRQHYCCTPETPEVCPTAKNLKDISQVALLMEGGAGNFSVEVEYIRAGLGNVEGKIFEGDTGFVGEDMCIGPIQSKLRYNISSFTSAGDTGFPFPLADGESLASGVCCDSAFADFAEPRDFYRRPDVNFWGLVTGVTTFYDSVCGIPLFTAPKNRTMADFQEDSLEHGWPSFRQAEVYTSNIKILNGIVTSTCGTHLGTYLPDADGTPRYCIDLSCIAGN